MTTSSPWCSLKTAIVVCGHAVYNGGANLDQDQAAKDEHWVLQSFQKGEAKEYISHVHAGVKLASEIPDSLLIFSGGQTRVPCILSEAQGYYHIASVFHFWNRRDVQPRATTEEFSRDSFDNVLFGIARFKEAVGSLPERLIIISWGFKEDRFRHHAWSVRWPESKFQFVGVGTPNGLDFAKAAEAKTKSFFEKDASGYGTSAEGKLGTKKAARNPYRRQHGYSASCPEMEAVLAWRGTARVPATYVPWA